MTSQIKKLNRPLTKYSFQNPCNTEDLPVEILEQNSESLEKEVDPEKTPTKKDSGFKGSGPSGSNPNSGNVFENRSRSSTLIHQSRQLYCANLSPIRLPQIQEMFLRIVLVHRLLYTNLDNCIALI